MHYISLLRRLILLARDKEVRIFDTGTALHKRLIENPADGTSLLKFAYGQLYNGKLALR
jgi:RNase P/RNase MRP subunit p30